MLRKDFLQVCAGWLVSNVEAILIMCTPLLSPLPSMFAAIRALERGGWYYAGLIGVIIETMGLAAGAFVGMVESHNNRHPDNQINPWWGRALFSFYFVVVEALILSSDPNLVSALLPGLTLVGSIIVGFRNLMRRADERRSEDDERKRESEKEQSARKSAEFELELEIKRREAEQRLAVQQAEAKQRLELERMKVEAKLVAQPIAQPPPPVAQQPVTVAQRRATLLGMLRNIEDPAAINKAELGRELGVSRPQVDKDIKALVSDGRLSINGVVKVLA